MSLTDRVRIYVERGEYHPSLDLAFAIAAPFELPLEAVFSSTPFEPMSARLYERSPDSTEPGTHA